MKSSKTFIGEMEETNPKAKAFIDICSYVEKIQNIDQKQTLSHTFYAQKTQKNKKEEIELLHRIKSLQEEKAAILQEKSNLLKKDREEEEVRRKQKIDHITQLTALKEKAQKEQEEIVSELNVYKKQLEKIELFAEQEPVMKEELCGYEEQLKELKIQEDKIEVNRLEEVEKIKKELKKEALRMIQAKNIELFLEKRTPFDEEVRLIIAQNHHYYSELEFQSQQKVLLAENNDFLREQLVRLKKEVEAHYQIEQELNKKRYFCLKIIKELGTQNKKLLEEITSRSKNVVAHSHVSKKSEKSEDSTLLKSYCQISADYRYQSKRKQAFIERLNLYSRFICTVLNYVKGLRKCFSCPQVFEHPNSCLFLNEDCFEYLSEEQQCVYFDTLKKVFTELYYLC